MKKINFLILIIISSILLNSCTIEKRLHRKGYHVQWNKQIATNKKEFTKVPIQKQIDKEIILEEKKETNSDPQTKQKEIVSTVTPTLVSKKVKHVNQDIKESNKTILPTLSRKEITKETVKKSLSQDQSNDNDQQYSSMAIAGFICGVLGLLLAIIIGWPVLLGTLGTIFSAIGLNQTSKGKKGRGLAIAGLVTSIIAIVLFWAWVAVISAAA